MRKSVAHEIMFVFDLVMRLKNINFKKMHKENMLKFLSIPFHANLSMKITSKKKKKPPIYIILLVLCYKLVG